MRIGQGRSSAASAEQKIGIPLFNDLEARMPRFHFEIVGGYIIEDPRGMDLNTEARAVMMAEQIVR